MQGDSLYQQRYEAWGQGLLSNHDVSAELGAAMLDMFWAQWLVETEDIPRPEEVDSQVGVERPSTRAEGPGSNDEDADADRSGVV